MRQHGSGKQAKEGPESRNTITRAPERCTNVVLPKVSKTHCWVVRTWFISSATTFPSSSQVSKHCNTTITHTHKTRGSAPTQQKPHAHSTTVQQHCMAGYIPVASSPASLATSRFLSSPIGREQGEKTEGKAAISDDKQDNPEYCRRERRVVSYGTVDFDPAPMTTAVHAVTVAWAQGIGRYAYRFR